MSPPAKIAPVTRTHSRSNTAASTARGPGLTSQAQRNGATRWQITAGTSTIIGHGRQWPSKP
eukprot:4957033-Pyramimonas_sp.AAC.1